MERKTRHIRYLILLLILFVVAADSLYSRWRTTDWSKPLTVSIYPINGDRSGQAESYVRSLKQAQFASIAEFLSAQAKRYEVPGEAVVQLSLGQRVESAPPRPGRDRGFFKSIYWSIAFRFWARWQLFQMQSPSADVAVFVLYFDPQKNRVLDHSVGLRNGMLGLVNAFADDQYQGSNNVIVAHELLHTLGATDKYNSTTNGPLFPIGFAEPDRSPLFPQRQAEIMGGRIPISPDESVTPESLDLVVVGEATALEIRWTGAE